MRYHDLCTRLLSANRLYPMAPKAATEARAIITTSAPVSSLLFIVPTKVKRDEIKIKITSLHPTGYPGDLKFPGRSDKYIPIFVWLSTVRLTYHMQQDLIGNDDGGTPARQLP